MKKILQVVTDIFLLQSKKVIVNFFILLPRLRALKQLKTQKSLQAYLSLQVSFLQALV
jgi:hypothetical protein